MTSDELKGTVSTILGQQHSAQLYLVLKVNDELVLRLADIEDESTAPEIQHMFEEFLETTIQNGELSISSFGPSICLTKPSP